MNPPSDPPPVPMTGPTPEVGVLEAQRLAAEGAVLLDVREPHEWAQARIDGAVHAPLSTLTGGDVPSGPVVVVCHSGYRSAQVTDVLVAGGRTDVVNMAGGMVAWAQQGLPFLTGHEPDAEPDAGT